MDFIVRFTDGTNQVFKEVDASSNEDSCLSFRQGLRATIIPMHNIRMYEFILDPEPEE